MAEQDLQADDLAAGFGNRLGFGDRAALIVIDFVAAYFDEGGPLYAAVEDTVEPAKRVLEAAREAEIPVVFTKVVYAADGRDGGVFFEKVGGLRSFVGESAAGQVIDALAPQSDELVVTKQYASSFFGTSLDSSLRAVGVDTVVLMGLSTSGCVRATAVDAIQLGFRPIVVADAVGDRDDGPHRANLFDLAAKYADVVVSDDVVAHLLSGSSPSARRSQDA